MSHPVVCLKVDSYFDCLSVNIAVEPVVHSYPYKAMTASAKAHYTCVYLVY